MISDSVEEGDKVVKTAIDNFGRIGEFYNSGLFHIAECVFYRHCYKQCWVSQVAVLV